MSLHVVTGGAGFIGSHLADSLLAQGHAVRVVDDLSTGRRGNLDPRVELLVGDVADAALVRRTLEGAAGVFHLAAIASVGVPPRISLASSSVSTSAPANGMSTAEICPGRAGQ